MVCGPQRLQSSDSSAAMQYVPVITGNNIGQYSRVSVALYPPPPIYSRFRKSRCRSRSPGSGRGGGGRGGGPRLMAMGGPPLAMSRSMAMPPCGAGPPPAMSRSMAMPSAAPTRRESAGASPPPPAPESALCAPPAPSPSAPPAPSRRRSSKSKMKKKKPASKSEEFEESELYQGPTTLEVSLPEAAEAPGVVSVEEWIAERKEYQIHTEGSPVAPEATRKSFLTFVKKQEFNGVWASDSLEMSNIGSLVTPEFQLALDSLSTSARPDVISALLGDTQARATILALQALKSVYAEFRSEWTLIAQKSERWLVAQVQRMGLSRKESLNVLATISALFA